MENITPATAGEPLNAMTLPLWGSRLIEASAGTGKTYTIANLYLRLLLGLDQPRAYGVDEILVVTFTNAATSELRDRIRRRLQQAFRLCLGESGADPFLASLASSIPDRQLALKQLDLALKTLDEAAIYTIHGFCQRVLSDMAFESSLLFEHDFTLDDSEYLALAAADFWRSHCYPLGPGLAARVNSWFMSPDALLRALRPLLGARDAEPRQTVAEFDVLASQVNNCESRLRLLWPRLRDETLARLTTLPLNGQKYGKQENGYPRLMTQFLAMDSWAAKASGNAPADALQLLSYDQLKLNKGGILPAPDVLSLLVQIEELRNLQQGLKPAFLLKARDDIRRRFLKEKARHHLLSPDDLLLTLARALGQETPGNEALAVSGHSASLAMALARRYPVALIDEFQDTDPLQFKIFSAIYPPANVPFSTEARGLLMIGDPKQAIYAFRGGDIHTYLSAREQAAAHYHLDTNYRSSRAMVDAVNRLFGASDHPFLTAQIPFDPVAAADSGTKALLIDGKTNGSALTLALLGEVDGEGLNKQTARTLLAEDAAADICRLLTLAVEGRAWLSDQQRPLLARDIAVLVRDRNEAAFVKAALAKRNIGAVFLSRDSVYNSPEARELCHILAALAHPRDEQRLRSAMATRLMGFSLSDIAAFNQDEENRSQRLEQFERWHQRWRKQGVMPALLALADETSMLQRLGNEPEAERRLTDFRHLCELLQQAAATLDGIPALLGHFEQKLLQDDSDEAAQLRLESEQNLVQIATIHKSKGLEYGLCYIPFLSLARDNRHSANPLVFHEQGRLVWDLLDSDEGKERQDNERLAEDLRLLYVALTRPIYGCRLGLANHSRALKSGISSEVHKTALGYLLGIRGKDCDFAALKDAAQSLVCKAITVAEIGTSNAKVDQTPLQAPASHQALPLNPLIPRRLESPWRIGSYTALVADTEIFQATDSHDQGGLAGEHFGADEIIEGHDVVIKATNIASTSNLQEERAPWQARFDFPRGANAGSFMHRVLELIVFDKAADTLNEVLTKTQSQFGIESHWQPILYDWYLDICTAPLGNAGQDLSLSQLNADSILVEMEFYLPVNTLKPSSVGKLLRLFGYRSDLSFDSLSGMLKGFVDLCFEYQGRYYIADYKSNHLGDRLEDYQNGGLKEAIHAHHYDLQYLLYTLALHRLLRCRLQDYDYDRHFGGCFYLFLRGMTASTPGNGVYFDKPPKLLIEALDALFEGREIPL